MGAAAGNVAYPLGLESLDEARRVAAEAGAVAELAVVTLAPREDAAVNCQGHRVFAAYKKVENNLFFNEGHKTSLDLSKVLLHFGVTCLNKSVFDYFVLSFFSFYTSIKHT